MNHGGLTRIISRKKIIFCIKKFSRKHILSIKQQKNPKSSSGKKWGKN